MIVTALCCFSFSLVINLNYQEIKSSGKEITSNKLVFEISFESIVVFLNFERNALLIRRNLSRPVLLNLFSFFTFKDP